MRRLLTANDINKILVLDTNLSSPTQNPDFIILFWRQQHHRVDLDESFRLVVKRDPETQYSVSKTDANFYYIYLIDSQPEYNLNNYNNKY